ncbi:MAG: hypothetical protein KatS3mg105_0923 [Gemmatales bacterium]|nr:MAG: hypothetical protein KatS3mg105_0923 [Gemmatales bacterium]
MKAARVAPLSGQELLRRALLGGITALVVARPLVFGEDPGLVKSPNSDAVGMSLTMLWFVLAAVWGWYRIYSGERTWYVGGIEAGLLIVVALVFASTAWSAPYKHPAWLIAWEWFALLLAFCLVRQLVRSEADQQRLLAAFVATAISLAGFGIYQHFVTLPALREELETGRLATRLIIDEPDARQLLLERTNMGIYATYSHPNSFASFLALLIPVGAGWAGVAIRRRLPFWKISLTVVGALLLVAALVLTKSRGGMLALVAVTLLAAIVTWRQWFKQRPAVVVGTVVLCGAAASLAWQIEPVRKAFESGERSLALRQQYWSDTWQMIQDHPWLGVGPGNFGRFYQFYMAPQSFEDIKDPHNFALEVWATSGIFAAVALLLTIGLFFFAICRRLVFAREEPPDKAAEDASPRTGTYWEYYLGGIAGLTLAFMLTASTFHGADAPDQIVLFTAETAGRTVLWFASFALLESIGWQGSSRSAALTMGVGAVLINLCVSGGIAFPSVAQPMWVAVALALACARIATPREISTKIVVLASLPILAGIALFYFFVTYYPTTSANQKRQSARQHYALYDELLQRADQEPDKYRQSLTYQKAERYFKTAIQEPLEAAVKADPDFADCRVDLAECYGRLWLYYYPKRGNIERVRIQALAQAHLATDSDPQGIAGWRVIYWLNMEAAQRSREKSEEFYEKAAYAMKQIVDRVPNNAHYRFQLAHALLLANDQVEAARQAQRAFELHQLATNPRRKLSPEQLQEIDLIRIPATLK